MYDPLSTPSPFASAANGAEDQDSPWGDAPASPAPAPTSPNGTGAPPPPIKSPGLYGKEPQIYGQPEPGLISPTVTTGSNGAKFERSDPYLRVRITALDRNRRDILIRFDAQTNLQNWTGNAYRNVSRSYFEFQQFYEHIVATNPQTIIPALPLAQTSAPTDEEDDRLVKIMLQRWFTRVCEDPILQQDDELRSFVESDFGYQPTVRPRRKGGSGFSLFKTPVPDEDEHLMRARFELTRLETQFFDAAKAVDKLARSRKGLSMAHAEMGNKLINVATTELHQPLGNAMRKLGRAWHSLADLDQAQAISECVILGDSLGYQGLNAKSARETLLQRAGVLEEHQAAVKNTIAKRRQIERLKASSNIRPDRVDEALEDLEEAAKYEQMMTRRVDGISQNLHRALQTHSRLAHEDIQAALIEHARSALVYERQFLRELESLRVDIRSAADPAPEPVKPVLPPARPLEDAPIMPAPLPPPPQFRPQTQQPTPVRGSLPPTIRNADPFAAHRSSAPLPATPVSPAAAAPAAANGPLGPLTPTSAPITPAPSVQASRGPPLQTSSSFTSGPFSARSPRDPLSPVSPGAGSSRVSTPANGSPAPGARPNGHAAHANGYTDPLRGTQSVIVTPRSARPGFFDHRAGGDPLSVNPNMHATISHAPAGLPPTSAGAGDPLGASMTLAAGGANPLARSMQATPTRSRLDAREAAAKLANFL